MGTPLLIGVLIVIGSAVVGARAMHHRFVAHLDGLERELQRPASPLGPRTDLPAEVVAPLSWTIAVRWRESARRRSRLDFGNG